MSSSREQAISQLRKWVDTKARLKASFSNRGVVIRAEGTLMFSDATRVWLVDDPGEVVFFFELARATPTEHLEPLLDLPEDTRWSVDSLTSESFLVEGGYVDFFEVATPEIDTDSPTR